MTINFMRADIKEALNDIFEDFKDSQIPLPLTFVISRALFNLRIHHKDWDQGLEMARDILVQDEDDYEINIEDPFSPSATVKRKI